MGLDPFDVDPEDVGPEPPEDWAEQDSIDVQERREFEENGPYE